MRPYFYGMISAFVAGIAACPGHVIQKIDMNRQIAPELKLVAE
jgi:hypothetical protein